MRTVDAYRETRERVTAMLAEHALGRAEEIVPACPEWTVRHVVAHLSGVCDDILGGRLDGVGTDPWTEAQVSARGDLSLEELLTEWGDVGPRMEEALGDHAPEQLVFDESTHEQDLRSALGLPGGREGAHMEFALNFAAGALGMSLSAAGLPALTVRSDGGRERTIGSGDPAATLSATSYDLLRSCTGRRTLDQIAALDWGGSDPTPWLPAFTYGPFTPPASAVE